MATTITTGIVTPSLTNVTVSAALQVGTKVSLSDGGEAVYCQALSEISQYCAVSLFENNTAQMLTTTTAGTTKRVGFADEVSIASGSFAWIRTSGRPVVKLASACADQVILFTTATSGVLDDATVSAALVAGVTSTVTISNATAITCIVPTGAYIHPFVNPA